MFFTYFIFLFLLFFFFLFCVFCFIFFNYRSKTVFDTGNVSEFNHSVGYNFGSVLNVDTFNDNFSTNTKHTSNNAIDTLVQILISHITTLLHPFNSNTNGNDGKSIISNSNANKVSVSTINGNKSINVVASMANINNNNVR